MKTGDIVLIQDSNLIRGQWKLGKVSNIYPGTDGKVRKVDVQYKNRNSYEPTANYKGKGYVTVLTKPHFRQGRVLRNVRKLRP